MREFRTAYLLNETRWHLMCSNTYSLAYLPIHKAANTSILYALMHLTNRDILEERLSLLNHQELKVKLEKRRCPVTEVSVDNPFIVHDAFSLFDRLIKKDGNSKWFKFTCVRHPIARFISFYKDKILNWDHNIGENLLQIGIYEGMTIEECIEKAIKIVPSELNSHIRPLHQYTWHQGRVVIDYWFKLEEIKTQWKTIEKIVGREVPLSRINESPNVSPIDVKINDTHLEMLKDYYYEDFVLFGYSLK